MMKIYYRVNKEDITEFLAVDNPTADFWGYLWFDFDGDVVGTKPPTEYLPRGYEPEDINGWREKLGHIKELEIGEKYMVIFCGANRLSIVFEAVNEEIILVKHYHDNILLWQKEYRRSEMEDEVVSFEKSITREIEQCRIS